MNDQIVDYLIHLKSIYLAIDEKVLRNDITQLDKLIKTLQETSGGKSTTPPQQKKKVFSESLKILLEKNYDRLKGTKLDYYQLTNQDEVECFIETHAKTKILKDATALDLKLLYSLLTEDPNEIKGTKSDVFEAIKRNIRARKRGEAFKNTIV
ncbi:hypothetical protein ACFFHM_10535 [Halalkalibacter kiskunsagensis]|uniref:Uncharacterized protein n=1 Tax=Halalkalibacter kiskunsagensis TaxID=1548599 RepID=A0ABV6KD92_9BACI